MTTAAYGDNHRTRDEVLDAILRSGQVSRIGQHLTLVLFHLCDTTTNFAKLSIRDLEQITGWSRETIKNHAKEIQKFFELTPGKGRAKTKFEMQGIITEYVSTIRENRDTISTLNGTARLVVANQIATKVAATSLATNVMANQVDTIVASQIATKLVAKEVDTIVASQVDATSAAYKGTRARAKSKPPSQEETPNQGVSLTTGETVLVEGGAAALPPQLDTAQSEAARLGLMADLRAVEDAKSITDKLDKLGEYKVRRTALWNRMSEADQVRLKTEQDRLRPAIQAIERKARQMKADAAALQKNEKLTEELGVVRGEIARAREPGVLAAIRRQYAAVWTALPLGWVDLLNHEFETRMTALGGGASLFGGVS